MVICDVFMQLPAPWEFRKNMLKVITKKINVPLVFTFYYLNSLRIVIFFIVGMVCFVSMRQFFPNAEYLADLAEVIRQPFVPPDEVNEQSSLFSDYPGCLIIELAVEF